MTAFLGCLVLWGLVTGRLQRWARHAWRWALVGTAIGAAALVGLGALRLLISLARLILWR